MKRGCGRAYGEENGTYRSEGKASICRINADNKALFVQNITFRCCCCCQIDSSHFLLVGLLKKNPQRLFVGIADDKLCRLDF